MDRCELAYRSHLSGCNCAQSVLCAFGDQTGLPAEQAMALAGGLGGGVGGSHEELCGAASGGVLVLSLLYPHTDGADADGKQRVYAAAKEFRRRFADRFGRTRCGDLLAARPAAGEKTPAALRLGVTEPCDVLIVTAAEILEEMLREREA